MTLKKYTEKQFDQSIVDSIAKRSSKHSVRIILNRNMKILVFCFVFALIFLFNELEAVGGVNEVEDVEQRKSYANKALVQLERASNSINARKIVEVNQIPFEILISQLLC